MVASKIRQLRFHLGNLLADDRGQSTTEYILILAVVVMIAMKFRTMMTGPNGAMTNMLQTLGVDLQGAVQDAQQGGN